jgi:RNA polymerase II subunit A small phosphatase-like protein
MSALSSLVTQVSEEDEKKKASASTTAPVVPKAKPSPAPAAEKKNKGGWWLFCCGCSKATEDDAQNHSEEKDPKPVAAPDKKEDTPKAPTKPVAPAADPAVSTTTPDAVAPPDAPRESQEPKWLLDPMSDEDKRTNKKTLVLDLDETLVHSSFTYIPDADFVIEIELDGAVYKVYVRKRPGVDEFMREVGKKFEVVVFTASLAKYADPLLDILDKDRVVKKRLFREACVQHYGNYVKDLSLLGRKLEHSIIIDNSPFSYMFQPDNAIPIVSWFNDKSDRQLYDLLPFLDSLIEIDDVSTILSQKSA